MILCGLVPSGRRGQWLTGRGLLRNGRNNGQQARTQRRIDGRRDTADYWNAHLAWFANKNLTLVGAYVNAGDEKSTSRVGLGDGFVLSVQYAF
jgi:hypothetical protein